ncbi:MAG: sulfate adenylyltransferase subunit CysD [Pseudomonadota bacterium]|jgi:sulfate adenylyltransferase subunit 2
MKATELNAHASPHFADKLAHTTALLQQAARDYSVVQASSLGAEDVVITHLIEVLNLNIGVFVLNTGELHTETLQLLERTMQSPQALAAPVQVFTPKAEAVIEFVQRHGDKAMYESIELRKACCDIRKMEPLARALDGKNAWITGLRREQSGTRAEVPSIDTSNISHIKRTKFNPLADWTWGDVWHYIALNKVDYNPLHDQFFPSIGCAPCTRAISMGEDFRAGRWWWEDEAAKECGLHVGLVGAAEAANPTQHLSNAHLDALEEETIFILREVAAAFERPALLFSGGKDSLVMLRCAEKAFGAGRIPYPLLMIDTGHNFPEVTDFRDFRAQELGAKLIVRSVEDSMKRGTVRLAHAGESRNVHQSVTLLEAIDEFRFDALIGGARRDEEKARAKERIFSHRDSFGQWQPKAQRPELWTLFNTRLHPGEHFRVFPISNWTELDVWQYIARENIALPSLYYTHEREVVERKGLLVPITPLTPAKDDETVEIRHVRFRTVGDITCTCPVESTAANAEDIVLETLSADVSERGATRMDDKTSEASMEKRKKDGYF